jgi:hypothetical protein
MDKSFITNFMINYFIAILIFVIASLIYADIIQMSIKSYCSEDKNVFNKIKTINAFDKYGNSMYKVEYNFNTKNANSYCTCKPGEATNKFRFKMRNLRGFNDVEKEKTCNCDTVLDEEYQYFTGEPRLQKYMKSSYDPSIFDNVMYIK